MPWKRRPIGAKATAYRFFEAAWRPNVNLHRRVHRALLFMLYLSLRVWYPCILISIATNAGLAQLRNCENLKSPAWPLSGAFFWAKPPCTARCTATRQKFFSLIIRLLQSCSEKNHTCSEKNHNFVWSFVWPAVTLYPVTNTKTSTS